MVTSEGVGGGRGSLVLVLGLARSPRDSESVADGLIREELGQGRVWMDICVCFGLRRRRSSSTLNTSRIR